MAAVNLCDIAVRFGDVRALDGVSASIGDGELAVVVGPSGSGKTTLLRVVAGLQAPDTGHVEIGGTPVDPSSPHRSGVAMVFQDEALYEHMTVGGNLAFPLLIGGAGKEEARRIAGRRARRVGISRLWARRPQTLSGGERGLVAAGRALSRPNSRVLLLDEPLARADRRLRVRFRSELRRIQRETGLTTMVATNDQEEASALADRLVVLVDGRIRQSGSPREIFERPADAIVAGFVGSPPMNLIPARLVRRGGRWAAEVGTDTVEIDARSIPGRQGRRVLLGVRAGDLHEAPPGTASPG